MVIFNGTRSTVKPATRKPFAAGLTINPVRQPFSAADLEWAAANLNADTTDYTVVPNIDQAAGEAAAQAAMEAGYFPG